MFQLPGHKALPNLHKLESLVVTRSRMTATFADPGAISQEGILNKVLLVTIPFD